MFHIRHIAKSDAAPFFRPGTAGSEINPAVHPTPGETVIEKSRPNSFVGTGLEAALRNAGITQLTLCGAMSQMCVDATARAAVDLGFDVKVVADACAAAEVRFDGVTVPAAQVHASMMAPLAASYTKIVTTHAGCLPTTQPDAMPKFRAASFSSLPHTQRITDWRPRYACNECRPYHLFVPAGL